MLIRVALFLLASLVLAPVAPASADPRPIDLLPSYQFFSPNGDGRKDRLPVKFLLRERAVVTVVVARKGGGDQVRRVRLGSLRAGEHAWRWDGRNEAGRPVPNGTYRIRLTAVGEHRTGVAKLRGYLDRTGEELRRARVRMSRDTIYPRTPDFEDRIYFRGATGGIRTELVLRDADGDVVRRTRIFGLSSWAGRDDAGELLPPGEYAARITMSDQYGNRRTTSRTLTISDQQLQPQLWSTTVRAADAELFWPEGWCPPAPSERFDGGITVGVTGDCELALFRPDVEVPFRLDPSTSWRVSVTGGPTTPGDPDQGTVSVRDGYGGLETPTVPGDGTTTTAWGQVTDLEWAKPEDWVFWLTVGDPGTSYDVAEFTVEVRYWTP